MSLWLPAPSIRPPGPPPSRSVPGPALFLDRDGVIIEDAHYPHDPEQVRLIPGAARALGLVRAAGFRLIGLSNQSGIGRGIITLREFSAVQARLDAELAAQGAWLDALFYCPHAPAEGCRCRKPEPGLLEEAARRFVWDPGMSWLVGDKLADVQLALAAGLRPVLVRTGKGEEEAKAMPSGVVAPIVADLPAAIEVVLAAWRAVERERSP